MITYWFMYLLPAWFAIQSTSRVRQRQLISWLFVAFIFIVLIGFRHYVGGDWYNYLVRFQQVSHVTLDTALGSGDPGYQFLSWWMAQWEWGIYGVNLIAAIVFMTGLTLFCRQQPRPWLAFSVAVPYLVIVVSMGYTRQAIAIGLFMWAITYLEREKLKYYLALVALAALFHKTAVLMIPLGIFLHGRGHLIKFVAVAAVAYGLWDLLLVDYQDELWNSYVDAAIRSEGANIRAFMSLVPSLILLYYWRKWRASFPNFWFWFWIAIGSIIGVMLVGVASTAVDRIALYFIPLQIVVFSRLPYLVSKNVSARTVELGILAGYSAVLFVWLNYAANARYWVPYQNVIFQ